MFNQFKRLIIGKPKRNRELKNEKISKFKALAILSSDALSSVAYGPEQILLTLLVLQQHGIPTNCSCSAYLVSSIDTII